MKSQTNNTFDLIVVGAGASGMIASIKSALENKKVLLLEKLCSIGLKLKATGGGRCNLSNTLDNVEFMNSFGRNGRFMATAIGEFNHKDLITFLKTIGVDTHIPDGFRIFPTTHNSETILNALEKELKRLNVQIEVSTKVEDIIVEDEKVVAVLTQNNKYFSSNVIIATGGLGYPKLGSQGEGHNIAKNLGHKITPLHPAMMPLSVKESWVENCRADTIAKAIIKVDIKKYNKLKLSGDLIFTSNGIRGPVVLDFSREITPLLEKYDEVPILINLTKGMDENQILNHIKKQILNNPNKTLLEHLNTLIPNSVILEFLKLLDIDKNISFAKIEGIKKDKLIKLLAWTPLTITGHDGFKKAMITRGGIDLKQIDPNSMQSKLIDGLYFCGEIVNLDGPCGGYNLQWSFSSGWLAGKKSSDL
ncbi:MAG: NAD(P)/FAD-dependent oxidoreductase [Campylobacterota bacterium]|nr:NAD(P)/FAD-dependent oxidoreductase [Campylobacterota bacterium]